MVTPQTATGVAEPGPNAASGQAEVDALLWLREEEKLARDVYLALAERWGTAIFENIAASEQRHMDAVAGLLDLYGLEDPVGSNGPGVFTDANLQKLYDGLLERGSASRSEAFLVGATIEDLDIHDLRNAIAASSAAEVDRVLGNLERASLNHLRAFAAQLERNGVVYTPEYLDAAEYESIVAAGPRHGNGGNRGSRRGLSG